MDNKIIYIDRNIEHVWGSYRELIVNDECIMRAVRIYEGGYNSLHYHPVDEIQIVENGYIKYYWMENWILNNQILSPGSVTFVKAGTPHRIEFYKSELQENGVKYCQIYELVLWEHNNWNYNITRLAWAKKAIVLPWEKQTEND